MFIHSAVTRQNGTESNLSPVFDTNDILLERTPEVLIVGLSSPHTECHSKHIISPGALHKNPFHTRRDMRFANGNHIDEGGQRGELKKKKEILCQYAL